MFWRIITVLTWSTTRKIAAVRKTEGVKTKGLKNLNSTEKTYVIVIVLALIGIVIKYVIL